MIAEVARSPSLPRTYLVNPRYADIGGTPCLPSLAALPEPVDLVLLAVPDSALEHELGVAARTGARSAVTSGSAFDLPGSSGRRDRLAAIAGQAGMAVCGAGCMGFVNVARGLRAVGPHRAGPAPGAGRAGHPLGFGVLGAAAGAPRLRLQPGRLVRPGAGHHGRGLRQVRAEPAPDPGAGAGPRGDQGRGGPARGPGRGAGRRRAGRAAERGRVRGRAGAGVGALRRAGRGRRRVGGAGRRLWPAPRPRPGRTGRHPRAVLCRPALSPEPRASPPCTTPGWNARTWPIWPPNSACLSPPSARRPGTGWRRCSTAVWRRTTRWMCGGPAATPSRYSPSACPRWPPTRP